VGGLAFLRYDNKSGRVDGLSWSESASRHGDFSGFLGPFDVPSPRASFPDTGSHAGAAEEGLELRSRPRLMRPLIRRDTSGEDSNGDEDKDGYHVRVSLPTRVGHNDLSFRYVPYVAAVTSPDGLLYYSTPATAHGARNCSDPLSSTWAAAQCAPRSERGGDLFYIDDNAWPEEPYPYEDDSSDPAVAAAVSGSSDSSGGASGSSGGGARVTDVLPENNATAPETGPGARPDPTTTTVTTGDGATTTTVSRLPNTVPARRAARFIAPHFRVPTVDAAKLEHWAHIESLEPRSDVVEIPVRFWLCPAILYDSTHFKQTHSLCSYVSITFFCCCS
jgi:hypothetical protein